mgnify:CR=1 FL=1
MSVEEPALRLRKTVDPTERECGCVLNGGGDKRFDEHIYLLTGLYTSELNNKIHTRMYKAPATRHHFVPHRTNQQSQHEDATLRNRSTAGPARKQLSIELHHSCALGKPFVNNRSHFNQQRLRVIQTEKKILVLL